MNTLLAVVLSSVVAVQSPQNPQTGEQPKPLGKISGVVTRRDTKQPIENVTIRLVRWEGGLGQPYPAKATDANGRFTFDGLVAGGYGLSFSAERFVSLQYGQATPEETPKRVELKESQHFENAGISLPPTTAIEGQLLDEFGDPAPGIVVQPAQVAFLAGKRRLMPAGSGSMPSRPTDDLGRFRIFNMPPGDYYLVAVAGPFAGPNDPPGFALTYFPGTVVPMEAKPVRLELGKDLSGLVFRLSPAPTATISGVVTDESGKPVSASLRFLATIDDDVRSLIMASVGLGADGAFTFRNVAPGTYVIQAYGRVVGPGNLGAQPFGFLQVRVSDTGEDVTGLQLKIPPGPSARGRILFEGDAPLPRRVLVQPNPVSFVSAPVGGGPANSTVREDWTFEVVNMSGLRMMRATTSPAGWLLKKVTLNGLDITDQPIDFRNGDVNGIEILLSSRGPVLEGTVTDAGKPAPDCTIVVFASDATKWAFPSRYFSQVRPDPKGWFQIGGLPPGDYLAVALPTVRGTDWQDPEFLKQHLGAATHFSLVEGSTQTITLKVYRR
jgi:5-hydroxyisourate hydrolase-like protein (transthyretin family)